jgi:polysaccharide pyruvyl transferase CsaB
MSITILIHGYYGFKNLGDELILKKIIEDIELLVPDTEIVVLSGDPPYTQNTHGIEAIDRFNINDVIDAVRRCDVIILGGGGLFNDQWPLVIKDIFSSFGIGIAYYAVPPLIAKILGKPVFYWAHGLGPFYTDEAVKLTKWAYSLADFVTLRDEHSHDLLKTMEFPEEKLQVDIDPVYKLDVSQYINEDRINQLEIPDNRLVLGVNLRPWKDRDQEIIEQLGRSLTEMYIRDKNILFFLIPFDFSSNIVSDFRILKKLHGRLPDGSFMTIDEEKAEPGTLLSAVSRAHAVIGMRLHFLMSALKLGKPAIALNYDSKVEEMYKILGLNEFCIDISINGISRVNHKISEAVTEKDRFLNTPNTFESIEYTTPLRFKEFLSGSIEASKSSSKIDKGKIQSVISEDVMAELTYMRAQVNRLQSEISDKDKVISDKDKVISDKDSIINDLNSRLSELFTKLNIIYQSKTWRIGQFYGRLFGREATWRRKISGFLRKRGYEGAAPSMDGGPLSRTEQQQIMEGKEQLRDFLDIHRDKEEIYFIFCAAPLFFVQRLSIIMQAREG